MSNIVHILTEQALTVFAPSGVLTCHAGDDRFEAAVACVRDDDIDALEVLLKPLAQVREYLSTNGRVEITGNEVLFDGVAVESYVANRILTHFREGNPVEPLINFMTNLQANPSYKARQELLGFLEYGDLPITPDGHFLAYKKVGRGDDYMDCFSGKIDNSIGQVVSMARHDVQDNSNITCSAGLHFCSIEYCRSFGGSHLMVLKINPADVVSIPTDYNNTKGRCCRYEVVGELDQEPETSNYWGKSLVDEYEDEEEEIIMTIVFDDDEYVDEDTDYEDDDYNPWDDVPF